VKIGPGQPNRSHTPDEYILLDELRDGAAAYERIVQEYFRVKNDVAGVDVTATAESAARTSETP
jgi:hypothetical protein